MAFAIIGGLVAATFFTITLLTALLMFIQAFIPKATVETLNKSVKRWLTRLDKFELHTMFFGPL